MWVRGLKHCLYRGERSTAESHPMWVRGLKPLLAYQKICQDYVAPYVGAWIETGPQSGGAQVYNVAPYVGAWIETLGG